MTNYHTSVLLKETIDLLDVHKAGMYIDATVGGAGHLSEIIKRGGKVLGIDTDEEALAQAKQILKSVDSAQYQLVHGNFRFIASLAKQAQFFPVDGILFDLGVSSHQLDTPERGFSYRFSDAPLDLRLDQTQGIPAKDLIQKMSREELYEIFTTYAEEKRSWPIVDALCHARRVKPITTTGEVLAAITEVIGGEHEAKAVASRIFQALRIAVNDELRALKDALDQIDEITKPGGRVAVISFHSLEDRIVKQWIIKKRWNTVQKKPVYPSEEEQFNNKRSRSAKLRVAQKP